MAGAERTPSDATRQCQECGQPAERGAFCDPCRVQRRRDYMRLMQQQRRAAVREIMRQAGPKVVVVKCRVCGEEFIYERPKRGRLRYWCDSAECKRAGVKATRQRKRESSVACRQCVVCGADFYTDTTRRVCSSKCGSRLASRERKARGTKPTRNARLNTCYICGREYTTTAPRSYCCSLKCSRRRHDLSRWHYKQKLDRRRYEVCRRGEKINPLDIFERDAWRCGICGKMTDRTRRVPHPKTPTIDHIIPIARGGEHVASNVQCACWGCNQRKRHLGMGQLRLFGLT